MVILGYTVYNIYVSGIAVICYKLNTIKLTVVSINNLRFPFTDKTSLYLRNLIFNLKSLNLQVGIHLLRCLEYNNLSIRMVFKLPCFRSNVQLSELETLVYPFNKTIIIVSKFTKLN